MRSVDDVQYENRLRNFDFDIIIATWPQSLSPGNEQRDFWSSQAADTPGSRNYVGIKNPAVDALIERVIFAKSRAELVAATRALDRVLLWNHYVVPQFTDDRLRAARWDRFGRPDSVARVWCLSLSNRLVVGCQKGRRDRSSSQGQEAKSTFSVRRMGSRYRHRLLHCMSAIGTFETSTDVRYLGAFGGKKMG